MDMNELLKFIEIENERSKKYYAGLQDNEKIILARTVKLSEELGELSEQVLAHYALQRQQKLDSSSHEEKLAEEFADVIITTLLLAKSLNIDVKKAIDEKAEKISERYQPA